MLRLTLERFDHDENKQETNRATVLVIGVDPNMRSSEDALVALVDIFRMFVGRYEPIKTEGK